MTANSTSPAPPTAIIDALNALLEAEQNSIFRFLIGGSPYLSRAAAEIRNPLYDMVRAGERRAMELADMVDRLGGIPQGGGIQAEEQYLAFLTLKFLLPKLLEAKELAVRRYENTLRALSAAPEGVAELLQAHLDELRQDLQALRRALG